VIAFFVLAFAISWGGVLAITLPTGIPGHGDNLDRLYGLVFLPMLAGPFLSAIILSYPLGGRAALLRLFQGLTIWRAKPIEYAAIVLLIPTSSFVVLFLLSLVSPAYTPGFLTAETRFGMIALFLMGGLLVGLIEETGWTGFGISRLLSGRSVLALGVGFGIIHGFWHLLVTVWAEGAETGLLLIPQFMTLWVLAIIVMRILIVWVYARTQSTLLAAVAHASHSGWLFAVWPPATTPVQDVIWTGAFGALGLAAVLALVHFAPPDNLTAGAAQ
jgi:membrane protease YdiL (CAAX protease family)